MSTRALENATIMPPQDLEAMLDLSSFLGQCAEPAVLLGPDGQTISLPYEAFQILCQVAEAMKTGKAITVAPVDQPLTTQDVADLLGMSRPTVVKLLESGRIPFESSGAGRHRRVRLRDVIDYQEKTRAHRRETLDQLTGDASGNGLYAMGAEDYREALAGARGKQS